LYRAKAGKCNLGFDKGVLWVCHTKHASERTNAMEELFCKDTPAQVARRVLGVLAEDPNLVWQVSPQKERPTDLRDVLSRTQGLPAVDLQEDLPVIYIYVGFRYVPGQRTMGGSFTAERLLDHTLLTASARVRQKTMYPDGRLEQSLVEDFSELAPIWEKVKAELIRLGLVTEAEPGRTKRAADAPKKRGQVGRRRDPDNDWAYQQVNEMGRTPAEVYPEWAERRRNHGTLKQLDDSLDSFKHAIASKKK
jgi:hypothetical protein